MYDPSFTHDRRDTQTPRTSNTSNVSMSPVSLRTTQSPAKPAVLLQTVTAWAESHKRRKLARIMFDTGSRRSFITKQLLKELNCRLLRTKILMVGVFGGGREERTFQRADVTLHADATTENTRSTPSKHLPSASSISQAQTKLSL